MHDPPKNLRSNALGKLLDYASVDVEQVIAGHTRLAWHTGWDHDNIGIFEGGGQFSITDITGDLRRSIDVAQITCDTCTK